MPINRKINWFIKHVEYKLKIIRYLLTDDYDYKVRKFHKDFGTSPNLTNPVRFNEKVICRMLYDNNELFTLLADKDNARKYIADVAGENILYHL